MEHASLSEQGRAGSSRKVNPFGLRARILYTEARLKEAQSMEDSPKKKGEIAKLTALLINLQVHEGARGATR